MKNSTNTHRTSFARRSLCIVSAMLVLLMTFTFIPAKPLTADAAESYWLYLCGTKVTSDNAADILGDGVFSYDAETNTLTISGDIEYNPKIPTTLLKNEIKGLTIYVKKNSTLIKPDVTPVLTILADTTITGPGVLNVEGGIRTISVDDCKLTIKNATVNAVTTNVDHGAAAIGGTDGDSLSSLRRCSLEVIDSNVTAKNEKNKQLPAITGFRNELTISGCKAFDESQFVRRNLRIENGSFVNEEGEIVHDINIEKYYDLEILGVGVNESNKANILGDGVFSYDEKTNTLTINGNFQTSSTDPVILNRIQDLTVTTASDSIISSVHAEFIRNKSSSFTLTTNGKLTVLSDTNGIASQTGNMIIKDADLCIEADSASLITASEGELNIIDSNVSLKSENIAAIVYFSKIILEGCKIVTPEDAVILDEKGLTSIHTADGKPAEKVVISKTDDVVTTTTTTATTSTTTTTSRTTTSTTSTSTTTSRTTTSTTSTSTTTSRTTTTTTSSSTTSTTTTTTRQQPEYILPGDTNCDGRVDLADAIFIMQALANPNRYQLTEQGRVNGDVDRSTVGITADDALAIQMSLLRSQPITVQPDVSFTAGGMFIIVGDNYNLYSGPGTNYSVIRTIPDYDYLTEVGYNESNDEWVYAEYRDGYGWIKVNCNNSDAQNISFNSFAYDKPVIYLYPEQETDVHVDLELTSSDLATTYPRYDNGWDVTAYPDGTLLNKADGTHHRYLFWDSTNATTGFDLSKGFCVAGCDTESFLKEKLTYMGLSEEEMNEFIVYWLPRMEHNAYNLISFQGSAYTDSARLNISPAPDSLLRIFMTYIPLEDEVDIEPQQLDTFERRGFTVVEWGGSQLAEQ